MVAPDQAYVSVLTEKDLRRQIDLAVCKAAVDGDYQTLLLADPAVILGERGCPPQQYLSLRSIQAGSLLDFARQARALFWAREPINGGIDQEDPLSMPVAVR